MAAEVDFPARREPAQMVDLPFLHKKSGFGKIIFLGDVHHQFIADPIVQDADGCLISGEYMIRKRIDDILFHKMTSF